MMDVATGRRPACELRTLLTATSNDDVSPPAPAHGLFLDRVRYPDELYLSEE
jgi:tRNA U38,U39,U40 pseudouridine synthase TruA